MITVWQAVRVGCQWQKPSSWVRGSVAKSRDSVGTPSSSPPRGQYPGTMVMKCGLRSKPAGINSRQFCDTESIIKKAQWFCSMNCQKTTNSGNNPFRGVRDRRDRFNPKFEPRPSSEISKALVGWLPDNTTFEHWRMAVKIPQVSRYQTIARKAWIELQESWIGGVSSYRRECLACPTVSQAFYALTRSPTSRQSCCGFVGSRLHCCAAFPLPTQYRY